MNKEYTTVYTEGTGEYEEKKSRFIATVRHVTTEEEAMKTLAEIRKRHYDARHNCYAYALGPGQENLKCSDDGEPSGTAGVPILSVLKGAGVTDCIVIVTRYFGGTLLGTGGLVRSYTKAAQDGLQNCTLAHKMPADLLMIRTDYNGIGKLQYMFAQEELIPTGIEYTDCVTVHIPVPTERKDGIVKKITDLTQGKAVVITEKEILFAVIGKETVLFDS